MVDIDKFKSFADDIIKNTTFVDMVEWLEKNEIEKVNKSIKKLKIRKK